MRGVRFSLGLVPVELHWDEGDEHRQRPGHADHHIGHFGCHLSLIAERAGDGPIAVQAYHTKVQNGRCGAHDVKGHPGVTEGAERPEAGDFRHRLPRHHQDGHQEVWHSQRDHKKVGHFGAQVSELGDCGTNERVSQQGGEDEQRKETAGKDAARLSLLQEPTVDDSREVHEIHPGTCARLSHTDESGYITHTRLQSMRLLLSRIVKNPHRCVLW